MKRVKPIYILNAQDDYSIKLQIHHGLYQNVT